MSTQASTPTATTTAATSKPTSTALFARRRRNAGRLREPGVPSASWVAERDPAVHYKTRDDVHQERDDQEPEPHHAVRQMEGLGRLGELVGDDTGHRRTLREDTPVDVEHGIADHHGHRDGLAERPAEAE